MTREPAHGNHAERITHRISKIRAAHEALRASHHTAAAQALAERAELTAEQPPITEGGDQ